MEYIKATLLRTLVDLKVSVLFIFIVFSNVDFVFTQQGTIKGIAISEDRPAEFVRISIYPISKHVLTSSNGEFQFNKLTYGKYTIQASFIGFKTISDTIIISEENSLVDVQMDFKEKVMELDAVVVTGTKTYKRQTNSNIIVNVLNSESLEMVQACNLSEGLKFQPGLRVETDCQTCNYTQLRMNGLSGGYSQILINGRPVFSPLTGLYGMEQLPVNMIDRVEVIRGGGSSLYGSREKWIYVTL